MAAIYAPGVRDTTTSFEAVPPSASAMAARIAAALPRYPFLVAERDGQTVGDAYAGAAMWLVPDRRIERAVGGAQA